MSTDNLREGKAIRNFVTAWLEASDSDLTSLIDWLQGRSLPAGVAGEPYLVLTEAWGLLMPPEKDRFCQRLVPVLDGLETWKSVASDWEEVVYNLLRFCGQIQREDYLAEPLQRLMKREAASGKFSGLSLRAVLRDALIRNQRDDRLWSIWHDLLIGSSQALLPGDVEIGFEGVLRMPSRTRLDQPDIEKLGLALGKLAEYFESEPDRESRFEEQLLRVYTRWGNALQDEMPRLADLFEWPEWTIDLVLTPVSAAAKNPPPKTPSQGPVEHVIRELREEMVSAWGAEREQVGQALREIPARVFEKVSLSRVSVRDRMSDEHHFLVEVEKEYRRAGSRRTVRAIERARILYMKERGLTVKAATATSH